MATGKPAREAPWAWRWAPIAAAAVLAALATGWAIGPRAAPPPLAGAAAELAASSFP